MFRRLYILTVLVIINLGCNGEKSANQKSYEWYENYANEEIKRLGLNKDEPFRKTTFDFNKFRQISKNMEHDSIIKTIHASLMEIQQIRQFTDKETLKKALVLIKIIEEHGLMEKETFYKDLINAQNDNERLSLYQKEEYKRVQYIRDISNKSISQEAFDNILYLPEEVSMESNIKSTNKPLIIPKYDISVPEEKVVKLHKEVDAYLKER
ncbi:hypothetical protein HCG49_12090 [Arenibacter sp. 6A1]|uniref:hypothetical protein n=1 Tax=Arenibacter sp. 6A1 TaxID=2720391 RepID=UPI001444B676|nr:hypothetical protein [Arenibacter sp. 6A1]NKI27305.1 hypothetical protein [Arenibacter sp. 6A1]